MRMIVPLLAVLVVTAGCSGVEPDPGTRDGGTATATRTVVTATATPAATETPTPAGVAGPPLNVTEVRAAHEHALRESGSVTYSWNGTVEWNGTQHTKWVHGRYDFDDGTALVTEKSLRDARSTTYLAANGSAYKRTGDTFHAGQYVSPPNVSKVLRPQFTVPADELPLTYRGRTTKRGVTGHVYATTNATAFANVSDDYDRSAVEQFEYGLVLAETGRIELEYVELTVSDGNSTGTFDVSSRYTRVGETTVERPDWFGEAVAAAPTPTPEGPDVRTFELSDDRGRVEETVTAPRWTYWRDAGPEHTGSHEFSYELMYDASVGPLVRLAWPDAATEVEASYYYEESQVPRDNESALTVVVYDREDQRLVPVEDVDGVRADVDADADVVTLVVTGEDALERYRGNAFFAMDFEYFRDNWPPD